MEEALRPDHSAPLVSFLRGEKKGGKRREKGERKRGGERERRSRSALASESSHFFT